MIDWKEIWNNKTRQSWASGASGIELTVMDLLQINGFHGQHGSHSVESFSDLFKQFAVMARITPKSKVFEFGCGAGAFLKKLEEVGVTKVGGLDFSTELIGIARKNLRAELGLYIREANCASGLPKSVDVVFAHRVFQYFPGYEYAEQVLRQMTSILHKKKSSVLAILDVRDLTKEKEYYEFRLDKVTKGSKANLGHLLYPEGFFINTLKSLGFDSVEIRKPFRPDYGNSTYSFDVFARNLSNDTNF